MGAAGRMRELLLSLAWLKKRGGGVLQSSTKNVRVLAFKAQDMGFESVLLASLAVCWALCWQLMMAADWWALARCGQLVLTRQSTFGYIAAGTAGVTPYTGIGGRAGRGGAFNSVNQGLDS